MLDMSEYKGRVAIVTGAASGMGLCLSRKICAAGGVAVMCDIDGGALDRAVSVINSVGVGHAWPCVADVRKFADAERAASFAIEKEGRLDLLVTFAGGYEPRMCNSVMPFYEQPVEVIDWGLDVNLKGAVYFARACMPYMVKAGLGRSVHRPVSVALEPRHGTAKSGLFNFVKGLAQAGARHGVRAFCVTPGPVMTRPSMAGMKTLLGHAAETEELVDFILFLSSDSCRCITGSNHVMDCGRLSMQPQ